MRHGAERPPVVEHERRHPDRDAQRVHEPAERPAGACDRVQTEDRYGEDVVVLGRDRVARGDPGSRDENEARLALALEEEQHERGEDE
jgi:hypothetical protein